MSDVGGDPPCWSHLFDDDHHDPSTRSGEALVADLGDVTGQGSGAVWSLPHGGDLDANLVRLEPDACIGEHVNDEVDVLVFVRSGTGQLRLGDAGVELASDHLVLIPKGAQRSVTAGPAGITYLSVHRRRGPLGIGGSAKHDR